MDKMKTGKTKAAKHPTTETSKKKPGHSAEHQERPISTVDPSDRADILPATHIDDDPESYRLT